MKSNYPFASHEIIENPKTKIKKRLLTFLFSLFSFSLLAFSANAQLTLTPNPQCSHQCCVAGVCNCAAGVLVTGGTPPYSYNWSGLSTGGPCVFGLCPGTYVVTVVDNNGASATLSITVGSCCHLVCADTTVCFSVPDSAIHLAKPKFISSNSGSNPSHDTCIYDSVWNNSPGVYPVGITPVTWYVRLTNGQIDSCTSNVTRRPPSVYTIIFSTSPPVVNDTIHVCNGTSITFTDNSTGTTGRLWNFGNGYYSGNAVHTEPGSHYPPGTYYDTLTVFDDCHNPHDTAFIVKVDSASGPDIYCISVVCPGDTVTYHTHANCSTYSWNVTGGTFLTAPPATSDSATVIWGGGPHGTISLSVSGCTPPSTCNIATIRTIDIVPASIYVAGDSIICAGSTTCYAIECIPGNTHAWEILPASAVSSVTGQGTCQICVHWNPSFFGTVTITVNYHNVLTGSGCSLPQNCTQDPGCGGSGTKTITIRPIFGISGPPKVCPNVTSAPFNGMNLTNNTIASGVSWKVITPVPSTLTFGTTTAFNAYTWNNGIGIYTITAYAPANTFCNDSATVTVEVVNIITPNAITGPDTVCANIPTFYSTAPNMNGVTYIWTVTGGTIVGPNNGSSVSISWNPGGGTVTVAQMLSSPPGCLSSATAAFTVVTWPNFSLPTITGNTTTCVNSTITYSIPPTLISNATYTWSIVPATAGNIISANGTNQVTIHWINAAGPPIYLKLKITRCYADSVMLLINLLAVPPVPNISYTPANPCVNNTVNFTTSSAGPTWNWNFGDAGTSTLQNPPHIYTVGGNYTIQLVVTNANGCSDTANTSIHVDSIPDIPVITGPTNVCINAFANYSFPQNLFNGAFYGWSLSTPALGAIISSNNNSLSVQWLTAGVDTVKLHVQSTCLDTILKYVVTVNGLPTPGIALPSPACEGAPLTFNGTGGVSYAWSFAGGSPSSASVQSPTITYAIAGVYNVSLSVTNSGGCTAAINTNITIHPLPTALISGTAVVCTYPATVNLAAVNLAGYSFLWSPTASTTASITYTLTASTTFFTVVTNSFGCTRQSNQITISDGLCDSVSGSCTVNDSIDFTSTPPVCLSQTYTKIDPAPLSGWNFGDGGSAGAISPVTHTFPYPGIYQVQVVGTATGVDAGGFSCTTPISRSHLMTIPFDAHYDYAFQCNGSNVMQVVFTNTSLFIGSAGSYNWTWYDSTTATTISNVAFPGPITLSAGTHTVALYIFDSATGATCLITHTFVVPVAITAAFSTSSPFCQGAVSTFTDVSALIANESSRLFDNGNGATSTASPAQLTYANSGAYTASLSVTDIYGCTSVATQNVNVNPAGTGTITIGPNSCDSVQLTASGPGPYTWSVISPPPSPPNPVYVHNSGFYKVTATSGSGCPYTAGPVQVIVNHSPTVVITGPTQYCQGDNLDLKTSAAGTTYAWVRLPSTPVGSNAANLNIVANTPGTFNYQVTVTAANGCSASASYSITVDPVPSSASIDSSASLTFCQGDSVKLFVNPQGYNYLWSKSPLPALSSPANTDSILWVTQSGTYSVIVQTLNGCPYPAITPVTVTVNPVPPANISGTTVLCEGQTLVLQTVSVGGATYSWTGPFASGNTNPFIKTNIQLSDSGTYTVVVTNTYGCTASATINVVVNPAPAVPFIFSNPGGTLCEGSLYQLCIQSPLGSPIVYNWNTGQMGNCINAALPGDYNVTATNQFGCSSASNTLTIHPLPDLSCVPTGCYDFCNECDSVTIPGPVGLASYSWQILTGGTFVFYGAAQNLTVYPPGGKYRLLGANQWGCADSTDTLFINFHDCCTPITCVHTCHVNAGNDTTICKGAVVTLSAQGCDSVATWYALSPTGLVAIGQGGNIDVTPQQNTCYIVICCHQAPCCCDTDTICVTVRPLPNLHWSTVFPTVCLNSAPVYLDSTQIFVFINNVPVSLANAGGSGYFSGTNVVGNYFYPSAVGTFIITYNYTDSNGCTGIISDTINVINCCDHSAACHISAGNDTTICTGGVATLQVQGCHSAATWFALNPDGSTVVIGQGEIIDVTPQQTTCYMVICCNPTPCCCDTDTICVTVRPVPQLHWSTVFPTVCLNSSPVYLDSTQIFVFINNVPVSLANAGGSGYFSGTNVIGNYFYPSAVGTFTITYNYTDSFGCTGTISNTITVINCCNNSSCHITAGNDTTICSGGVATLHIQGCQSTAVWYALNPDVGPVAIGQGEIIDVTPQQTTCYMVICCNPTPCCCDTDTICVTVRPVPRLHWSTVFPTVCLNSSPVYLDSTQIFVFINNVPVSLANAGGSGYFSGTNVVGNYFYPSAVGTFTITYNYTDSFGCTGTISDTITVINCCDNSSACHISAGNDTTICAGGVATLHIQGCQSTAVWYALNPDVGPVAVGQGEIIDVTPQQTTCYMVICCNPTPCCCDTDTICVTVRPVPRLHWSTVFPTVCLNSSPVYLDSTQIFVFINNVPVSLANAGGSGYFSGTNVVGNYFYPSAVGTFTITYNYTDSFGCSGTISDTIAVINCCNNASCHIHAGNDTTICTGGIATLQVQGCQSTATWYTLTGEGPIQLGYGEIIDVTPQQTTCYMVICCNPTPCCCDTDTICVTVRPVPQLHWSTVFQSVCLNSAPVYLDSTQIFVFINNVPVSLANAGGSGYFSGTGVIGNYFYPNSVGTFTITYYYTDPYGCTGSISNTITVINCCNSPNCHINAGNDTTICSGGVATLQVQGCQSTATWYALAGQEHIQIGQGEIIDVTPQQTTCYMVICCNPYPCCCDTDTICVTVHTPPHLYWLVSYADVCQNSSPVSLGITNIFALVNNTLVPVTSLNGSGVFSGPNVNGSYFYPSSTGTFTVTFTFTDAFGCISTVTNTITVISCINHITMSLQNCAQPTPKTIEFDLYVVSDGSPLSDLRANAFQYGINFNTGILPSGASITTSYIAGTSVFIPPLNGFNFPASGSADHIRIVESPYTGSNTGNTMTYGVQYKVGRFRLTSTANWVSNSSPNFNLQTVTAAGKTATAGVVWIGPAVTTTSFVVTGAGDGQRSVAVSCSMLLNHCNVIVITTSTAGCLGLNNGTATAVASGGFTPYEYHWSNGQTTDKIVGLSAGTYPVTVIDAIGCHTVATATVTVLARNILNLKLFIEGYYLGNGQMQPVMKNELVQGATPTQADSITIELHQVNHPDSVVESAPVILMTDGSAQAVFSAHIPCHSYWIVVKHRSAIQTWSAAPVAFNDTDQYDFTISSNKAYGSNMTDPYHEGTWSFYNGDINQDGNIDLVDFPALDTEIIHGFYGYSPADLNGDGNVDLIDFPILDENLINGVFSKQP